MRTRALLGLGLGAGMMGIAFVAGASERGAAPEACYDLSVGVQPAAPDAGTSFEEAEARTGMVLCLSQSVARTAPFPAGTVLGFAGVARSEGEFVARITDAGGKEVSRYRFTQRIGSFSDDGDAYLFANAADAAWNGPLDGRENRFGEAVPGRFTLQIDLRRLGPEHPDAGWIRVGKGTVEVPTLAFRAVRRRAGAAH